MDPKHIEIVSNCSPAECTSRLQAATDVGWKTVDGSPVGDKPVVGYVTGASFALAKRIGHLNFQQKVFKASIVPRDKGSLITGECVPDTVASWSAFIWYCVATLVSGGLFGVALTHPSPGPRWPHVLLPVGFVLFPYLVFRGCRWLARGEAEFLVRHVTETLQGQVRAELPAASPRRPQRFASWRLALLLGCWMVSAATACLVHSATARP